MKKQIFLIGTLGCLFAASCDNSFDNIKNQNNYDDITYFTTTATIGEAVTATYALLLYPGMHARDFYYLIDGPGNEVEADKALNAELQLMDYSYAPTNQLISDLWSTTYKMILRANLAIERAANITPLTDADKDKLKQYVGEAYFLKSYAEFLQVTLWGRVPIRKDYEGTTDFYLPRASTEEVWKQIESDLTNAINGLPVTYTNSGADLGRATKGAAIALLGKSYLYQKRYAEAATQFQLLTVAPFAYDLVSNLDLIFTKSPVKNAETVFDIPHKTWGGWSEGSPYYMFGSQEGSSSGKNTLSGRAMEYGFNDWVNVYISDAAVNAFTYNDENGQPYVDPRGKNTFYGAAEKGGDMTFCDNCATGVKVYPYAEKGFRWRKYETYEYMEKILEPKSDINSQVIRYADVLLMLAESYINLGKIDDALPLINKVRGRSGAFLYTSLGSQDQAMQKIMLERQLELAGEQVRWFDLNRWGVAKDVLNAEKTSKFPNAGKPFFQEKHKLFPIPNSEKITNPKIALDIENDWN